MEPSLIKKRESAATRFLLILVVCVTLLSFKGVGQAIILKGDTLSLGGDTVVHLVMLPFRGSLQWESSDDSTHWNRIAATSGDTLTVRSDREGYFRAVITEGSCDPLISGIVQILHFPPVVHSGRVTRLDTDVATIEGEVTSEGGAPITSRGICFSLSPLPTIDDQTVTSGAGTGPFTATLTGLTPDSDWYARAFATNSKGTSYGEAVSFRTLPEIKPPTVVTGRITAIRTGEATIQGEVTGDGGASVTSRGICYSRSPLPTIDDQIVTSGTGTGLFSATLTGLTPDSDWHARAFATNSKGTAYGEVVSFRTLPEIKPPTVVTGMVTATGTEEATIQGEVTNDGGATVTSRGICYSRSPLPTIDDQTVTSGAGTGPFSVTLTGLTPDTDWYARAFATNNIGTSYGEAVSFRTLPVASPTVTDIDGNVYPIVKIGEQWWMALNLRVTRAPDGSSIPSNEYPGDPAKAEFYGRYYSWDVAMNNSREESAQGICPDGWHLPSDDEVKLMEIALGMNPSEVHVINGWRGAGVGTKMKPGGSSGLDIPLAGLWYPGNLVLFENESAYFYTSTEAGANAWRRCLSNTSSGVGRYDTFPKSYGFSIRCIKDN